MLRFPARTQSPKTLEETIDQHNAKKRHKTMKIRNLKYMFANRNSCRALCGRIKNGQGLFNSKNQIL